MLYITLFVTKFASAIKFSTKFSAINKFIEFRRLTIWLSQKKKRRTYRYSDLFVSNDKERVKAF